MAIRILSSENINGNITIHSPSNAPYIDFVENADTGDSKARITMDQIDTNNGTLLFATENAGTLFNQVKITQTGNLLLSNDAASFNTSNAKLNVLPASSGVYQQWNYSPSNNDFSLKLKETVTSGNVRYVFEQINNTTTYPNTLVFNQGNIGIGTDSPGTLHGVTYGTTRLHVDGGTDRGQMIIEGDSFAGIVLSDNGTTANEKVFATSVDDGKYTIKPLNDNGTSTVGGVAVTVLHDGNVGIGETAPESKLEISDTSVGTDPTALDSNFLMLTNKDLGTGAEVWGIGFNARSGVTNYLGAFVQAYGYFQTAGNTGLIFGTRNTSGVVAERMRIDSTGNVGIGTTSPDANLEIFKSSGPSLLLTAGGSGTAGFKITKGDSGTAYINNVDNVGMQFQIANGTKMTIASDGKVGIGTTSPGAKLEIKSGGGIHISDDTAGRTLIIKPSLSGAVHEFTSDNTAAGYSFSNNSSEFMRIDSAGNVGIGNTSPSSFNSLGGKQVVIGDGTQTNNLTLYSATTGGGVGYGHIAFADSNASGSTAQYAGLIQYYHGNDSMQFYTDSTPRMTITSGGDVCIGTTTPSSNNNYGTGDLNVENNTFASAQIFSHSSTVGNYSFLGLGKSSGTGASPTIVVAQETVASIGYYGYDGSGYKRLASIDGAVDGTPGAGDMPGRLTFSTTADGASTPTERMRITSGGLIQASAGGGGFRVVSDAVNPSNLIEYYYSSYFNHGLKVEGDRGLQMYSNTSDNSAKLTFYTEGTERMRITSAGDVLVSKQALGLGLVGTEFRANGQSLFTCNGDNAVDLNRLTNDGGIALFRKDGIVVGTISVTGSATAYNTSSDYRLKEDLQDFAGLDMVSKIPVYDFKWKTDESRSYGVMAHELQEVLPDAVSGEKDAEEMQGVDYSKIVPLLVKSIQELKAEIELLKNK